MSEPEKWFQHCSHSQHKLKEVYSNTKFKCQVCKHEDEGFRYRCDSCTSSFEIDTICATLTERLSSFTHPQHPLALRPTPFLLHRCRLCRGFVTGIVYRCEAHGCKFFLHPLCSQLPPELHENHCHPPHPLSKKCDVCQKKCDHWRYHCDICDVHIHVSCLASDTSKTDATAATAGQSTFWTIIGRMADIAQLASS